MAFNWSGLANSTINKYIRGETIAIIRKRIFLAMLQSRGRITLNESGKLIDWKVRYKRSPMLPFTDGDTITFVRQDKRKTAQVPMKSYIASQSMNKGEKLQNSGKEAIVKLYASMVKDLMEDVRDQFCNELVQVDGTTGGNADRLWGLPTLFGSSSDDSNSLAGLNTKTSYAGISQVRGAYGGSWTGNWPDGYGDPHFDFWSSLDINYTGTLATSSGGWNASTKTFRNTGIEAIRYGIVNTQRNGDDVDFFLLEKNMYRQLLELCEQNERLVVNRNQDVALTKLGFRGINIDGVDIYWEYGLPVGYGYGLCMDQLQLHSWQDQLFKSSTDFDLESVSDRVAVDFYGNLRAISPRCQCRLVALG